MSLRNNLGKRGDPASSVPLVPAKRAKASKAQSSLTSFFGRKDPPGRKTSLESPPSKKESSKKKSCDPPGSLKQVASPFQSPSAKQAAKEKSPKRKKRSSNESNGSSNGNGNGNDNCESSNSFEKIQPEKVTHGRNAQWKVVNDCILIRKVAKQEPRTKVAGFDLDGTILDWTVGGWPSSFDHYELWNSDVLRLMREKHDEGYKLVIFSNQGGIRKAFTGKTATLRKDLIEWLAQKVDRPLFCCISTSRKDGYHKPSPGMWEVCEEECNQGVEMDVNQSFYVGDSVGDDDPQGGVDEKFAKNVGRIKGGSLKFYEPPQYFGPSHSERRKTKSLLDNHDKPSDNALKSRAALLGGYLEGPILLVLCGVQGSGKSTFSGQLVKGSEGHWVAFSQDSINKGKPGTREKVERETRMALGRGQSVVVDRMHLDREQRSHFVRLATEMGVPVHSVTLNPPKEVISKRVRARQNHPGKVEGEKGVRIALASLSKLRMAKYDEGFDLISATTTDGGVEQLYTAYRSVAPSSRTIDDLPKVMTLHGGVLLPSRALGTMKIPKKEAGNVVRRALEMGFRAVDTAPTYNNEREVGKELGNDDFCIVKVPYRAVWPEQVRSEILKSLANLGKERCSLLLLHWPANFIDAKTLETTWQELEKCQEEGLCSALGVCNFNIDALRKLLGHCKQRPCINQVERHPLLPQWDLLDFCLKNDILLQSHTCLGQGKQELFENGTVRKIASACGMSPAQVLVQWNLRHGVPVVVKCSSGEHMKEILAPKAKMTSEEMKMLDGIKRQHRFVSPPFMFKRGSLYAWN